MAGTIVKIKQSSVAGRLPTHNTSASTDIVQGELALNTADQKLYSKNSSGTVFEIGGGSGGAAGANEIITTDFTATNGQTQFAVTYTYANDHVNVYYNGIKLSPDEYTATSGSLVVLDTGAVTGATISIEVIKALNLANGSDITEYEFTATANQTTFAISGGYNNASSDIEVYVNGVKIPSADFTATNDTQVVLGTGATVNDQVAIRVIKVTVLTSTVSQTSETGAAILPAGTTAQRDGSPAAGYLRWNSTLSRTEVYSGSTWMDISQSGLETVDEDNMSSNSATKIPTQQSVKAYVDTQVATIPVGDITSVVAGTGLTGGGTTGDVTVNIDSSVVTLTGTQTLSAKTLGATAFTGAITTNSTFDTRDVATDGTKLDTIETNATADQTGAQIKTAYEAETNAFTDAQFTKLSNIETAATADQTGAQIKTLYQAETNAFTDAQFTKLSNIEASATADQTNAEIRAAVVAATNSNAFTDAEKSKLNAIEASATADQTAAEIRVLVGSATDSNVYTDALNTKLAAIEASADVTDATNVNAAGALMLSDTTTAGLGIVVDEDNMASDLATKVPTQQSVKAYVDTEVAAAVTASDLDFSADSGGALSIDLDSETMTFTGGTGITTVGNTNDVSIGIDSSVATLTGTQILTNKTLTTPTITSGVLNTGVSGTAIKDQDNMSSNSATHLATQQSIKAYVDAQTTDETAEGSSNLYFTNARARGAISAGNGISISGGAIAVTAVALTTVQTASSQSAQLALTTEEGDVVVRSDENKSYVRNSGSAGNMNDFTLLATPTDSVLSVNGQTGAITAAQIAAAVEAASNSNTFTDADHTIVNAAVQTSDTTTSGMGFVLDEDNMASNSATKLSTQQAIKAYVDAQIQTVPDAVAMSIALG